MKRLLLLLLVVLFSTQLIAQKRAITVEDLWKIKRIGAYDVSPDGKTIAFTVTAYDMDSNKGNSDIYLINSDGTNVRPFMNSTANESDPKFSPDGKKIAYSFKGQIWVADIFGKNEMQLTDLYTGTSGHIWSKDGKKILFVSSVYPDCETQECNKEKDEAKENSKVKAEIFTELMYRHWNDWRGPKRSHLYVFDIATKEYYDVTLKSKNDVPPIALGGSLDYSISPDGSDAALTMNQDEMLATSTNNDVFTFSTSGLKKNAAAELKKISSSKGNDNQPVYSPDGKYIAFRSMKRAGFEADKLDLIIYDRTSGSLVDYKDAINLSVGEVVWSADSKSIYFTAEKEIFTPIFRFDIASKKVTELVKENLNGGILLRGDFIFFKKQKSTMPVELFSYNTKSGEVKQITNCNTEFMAKFDMQPTESFWSEGAEGAKVQSLLIKPPFFDPNKKYPMIFLIHGGPQGNWADDFHFRWNTQLFASKGYVVVAPNPRGSTGYGQKFTDEISGDWGGKAYIDLMNTYDNAIKTFPFIDGKNTFAAGGSYGGYMVNWIAGHTDRFNALVSHAGVFDLESMYGATEELWFPEWEYEGTPWTNRAMYEKWSPHRYADKINTPMLVVHGAFDFRVPEGQAFELFTTLQRRGIPSKFLYFPDETHFVTKPQNAKLWWNTIFDWFDKYTKR